MLSGNHRIISVEFVSVIGRCSFTREGTEEDLGEELEDGQGTHTDRRSVEFSPSNSELSRHELSRHELSRHELSWRGLSWPEVASGALESEADVQVCHVQECHDAQLSQTICVGGVDATAQIQPGQDLRWVVLECRHNNSEKSNTGGSKNIPMLMHVLKKSGSYECELKLILHIVELCMM